MCVCVGGSPEENERQKERLCNNRLGTNKERIRLRTCAWKRQRIKEVNPLPRLG